MRVGSSLAALLLATALAGTTVRAQVAPPGDAAPPPAPTSPTTDAAVVREIVEVTQVVNPGADPVAAFTPPEGVTLVVTDVVVTNPNTSAACGVDLARNGTGITGGLCVPPRSSLPLGLLTGIEFAAGTAVQLVSAADAGGPVRVHLRGFLLAG